MEKIGPNQEASWKMQIEQLNKALSDERERIREMQYAHDRQLNDLRSEHEKQRNLLKEQHEKREKELKEDNYSREREIRDKNDDDKKYIKEQYEDKLKELKEYQRERIRDLERQFDKEKQILISSYEQKIENLKERNDEKIDNKANGFQFEKHTLEFRIQTLEDENRKLRDELNSSGDWLQKMNEFKEQGKALGLVEAIEQPKTTSEKLMETVGSGLAKALQNADKFIPALVGGMNSQQPMPVMNHMPQQLPPSQQEMQELRQRQAIMEQQRRLAQQQETKPVQQKPKQPVPQQDMVEEAQPIQLPNLPGSIANLGLTREDCYQLLNIMEGHYREGTTAHDFASGIVEQAGDEALKASEIQYDHILNWAMQLPDYNDRQLFQGTPQEPYKGEKWLRDMLNELKSLKQKRSENSELE